MQQLECLEQHKKTNQIGRLLICCLVGDIVVILGRQATILESSIYLNQVTIEPPFTKIICPDMYEASSPPLGFNFISQFIPLDLKDACFTLKIN
jgi:hypothetical protein